MTAVTQPRIITFRRSIRVARVAIVAFLVLNVVVVQVMFAAAGPARNLPGTIGRLLGLHLALALALQLLLVARLPVVDRAYGMDRLTTWHRWTGLTIFWLALAHPAFVLLGFARLDRVPILDETVTLAGQLPVLLGMIAVGLLLVVVGLSIRAARRRLSYETWHFLHLLMYVVILLGVLHQLSEGTAFTVNAFTEAYWWGLWAFALGALLAGRLIVPLIRNARHRLRVAAVVDESADTVSVHITGRDLDRLDAHAGQFFLWRFPGHNPWWQANPFSLSAAPNSRSLRLTAKGVGATSAGLRDLPPGARVYAEGPYGAFTAAHRTRAATVLIAGGIGITPIRALLEDPELTGHIIVLYRVRTATDAVLLGELRNLTDTRHARLHLLAGRSGTGYRPFAPDRLKALIPDITARDVYVCGPDAMTTGVLDSLRRLRVPARQVHAERFRLAG
ncbi:oxidoreductase [Actinoplanes sp. SE50]|uniref:ferredoxin reductase family protein n=1 Tax=unclassified Actinoplanes TaxID=2626549 RepID=UPI00023EBF7B|nr:MULTISPECIES: ferredoxin reductase family protein [unclassified Actinoplanes]AEV86302.1 Dual oxidase 2 [Actinoplanes sp. SE50/110]ATO84699.1 oxidoreductase [Actinoplanes sp. SE50]SLM02109.1 oxidoreductase [Actinoplanes sp. SE50/110]